MDSIHIAKPRTLTEALERECQFRHFKRNTFYAYASWLKRFYLFHGRKPVSQLGTAHVQNLSAAKVKSPLDAGKAVLA